jgi:hypothetical protein
MTGACTLLLCDVRGDVCSFASIVHRGMELASLHWHAVAHPQWLENRGVETAPAISHSEGLVGLLWSLFTPYSYAGLLAGGVATSTPDDVLALRRSNGVPERRP